MVLLDFPSTWSHLFTHLGVRQIDVLAQVEDVGRLHDDAQPLYAGNTALDLTRQILVLAAYGLRRQFLTVALDLDDRLTIAATDALVDAQERREFAVLAVELILEQGVSVDGQPFVE